MAWQAFTSSPTRSSMAAVESLTTWRCACNLVGVEEGEDIAIGLYRPLVGVANSLSTWPILCSLFSLLPPSLLTSHKHVHAALLLAPAGHGGAPDDVEGRCADAYLPALLRLPLCTCQESVWCVQSDSGFTCCHARQRSVDGLSRSSAKNMTAKLAHLPCSVLLCAPHITR